MRGKFTLFLLHRTVLSAIGLFLNHDCLQIFSLGWCPYNQWQLALLTGGEENKTKQIKKQNPSYFKFQNILATRLNKINITQFIWVSFIWGHFLPASTMSSLVTLGIHRARCRLTSRETVPANLRENSTHLQGTAAGSQQPAASQAKGYSSQGFHLYFSKEIEIWVCVENLLNFKHLFF